MLLLTLPGFCTALLSVLLSSVLSAAFGSVAGTAAFGSDAAGFAVPFTGEPVGCAVGDAAGAVAVGDAAGVVGFVFCGAVPEQADANAADAAKTVPRITDLLIVFPFTPAFAHGSFRYAERANGDTSAFYCFTGRSKKVISGIGNALPPTPRMKNAGLSESCRKNEENFASAMEGAEFLGFGALRKASRLSLRAF